MTRAYTLPEILPGEDNNAWCRRAADAIPPGEIVRALVAYLDRRETDGLWPTRKVFMEILGHGAGVSAAVAEKYRMKGD